MPAAQQRFQLSEEVFEGVQVEWNGPVPVEKFVIDNVEVNPNLKESPFAEPKVQIASIHHP
jgi:hypothetical protein